MITRQDDEILLFNLCHIMGVDMTVIDITTFVCSECGKPIPDRLTDTIYFHPSGIGIAAMCQDCHDREKKSGSVAETNQEA
jgi:uncharacterized protein YlaI